MESYQKDNLPKLEILFAPDGYTLLSGGTDLSATEKDFAENYNKDAFLALYELAFSAAPDTECVQLLFLYRIACAFIKQVSEDCSIELTRNALLQPDEETAAVLIEGAPFSLGSECITQEWLSMLWARLGTVFTSQLNAAGTSVGDYLSGRQPSFNIMGRVYFHLVENKDGELPFAFLAAYCKERGGKVLHLPLKNALVEFKGRTDELLGLLPTVLRAAEKSAFIADIMESGDIFSPIGLTSGEAYTFLSEVSLYHECGILCHIPDWWKKRARRIGVSVTAGEKAPSRVGADALLSFNAALALDGEELTEEDIKLLLSSTEGLVFIKGKWVDADASRIREALAAFERARKLFDSQEFTLSDAMRMQLGLESIYGAQTENEETISISNGTWLSEMIEKMSQPSLIEDVALGRNFRASLRPYQTVGFKWLYFMYQMRLGACLSDDMGLGKTVQVIALLDKLREEEKGASLLIIPASLIENWQKELDRFAPSMNYKVLHKSFGDSSINEDDNIDLYITTYGMAAKSEELQKIKWETVILDEAQAIKNPSAKQTKIIRKLNAGFKLAMTGTPVENRLTDLWSIFDFLNAGLLGTLKEFAAYSARLRRQNNYTRLKQTVSPFILRRLKTDKSILPDLPEKIEMKKYPHLAKQQIVLYQTLVEELQKKLEDTEGIERKGIILSSIIKFKQLCNHPDLYTGQASFAPTDSGKLEILAELCETIREKRERMLIFTQFKEMCAPLDDFLFTVFGKRGLVLHGGTQVKRRGEIVERFNAKDYIPYMVLSLKAGGVGLNLTAANHVVHYDRWWNPAVENQATDRAFRIGQTKNVLIHKLITKGTIEEKIDAMIDDKQWVANEVLSASGENWITELPTEKLISLFRLEV